jgi:hypothetical protein
MAQMTGEEADALEAMVDRCGLETVVAVLAVICAEKAQHVQANWQDRALAKAWDRCTAHLNKAENAIAKENLS